jgi:hypothetical protein
VTLRLAVVRLDLQAIGQNLSPEEWYDGLLDRLGRQLQQAAVSRWPSPWLPSCEAAGGPGRPTWIDDKMEENERRLQS